MDREGKGVSLLLRGDAHRLAHVNPVEFPNKPRSPSPKQIPAPLGEKGAGILSLQHWSSTPAEGQYGQSGVGSNGVAYGQGELRHVKVGTESGSKPQLGNGAGMMGPEANW